MRSSSTVFLVLFFIPLFIQCSESSEKKDGQIEQAVTEDTSLCDINKPVFYHDVKGILDKNCMLCHKGNNPLGKIHLDNYDSLSYYISTGKVLESIERTGDFPMPPSYSLQDDEIKIIQTWINAGFPNN